MPEYIEREATIKALKDNTREMECYIGFPSNIGVPEDEIEDIVNEIPAADVVEVVRCKDCQYGRGNADGINLKVPFMYFCTYDDFSYNGEDHFCSYGKRKEGAEE